MQKALALGLKKFRVKIKGIGPGRQVGQKDSWILSYTQPLWGARLPLRLIAFDHTHTDKKVAYTGCCHNTCFPFTYVCMSIVTLVRTEGSWDGWNINDLATRRHPDPTQWVQASEGQATVTNTLRAIVTSTLRAIVTNTLRATVTNTLSLHRSSLVTLVMWILLLIESYLFIHSLNE